MAAADPSLAFVRDALIADADRAEPRVTGATINAAFTAEAIAEAIMRASRALILAYEDSDPRELRRGLRELKDARGRLDELIREIEREG